MIHPKSKDEVTGLLTDELVFDAPDIDKMYNLNSFDRGSQKNDLKDLFTICTGALVAMFIAMLTSSLIKQKAE